MDPRLQEMLDHHEIRQTLSDYCHGCDRGDEAAMASVYLADSWDDHGSVKATGPEFARIMSARIREDTRSLSHMLGQSLIKVDGDEAGADTYFLAVAETVDETGARFCNQLGGRFVDRFRREDGRWRIKRRVVVRDWSVSMKVDADWIDDAGLTNGERSDRDPSFGVLRRLHGGVRT